MVISVTSPFESVSLAIVPVPSASTHVVDTKTSSTIVSVYVTPAISVTLVSVDIYNTP